MSINDYLHLATTITPEELTVEVHAAATSAKLLPPDTPPAVLFDDVAVLYSGMLLRVRGTMPRSRPSVVADLGVADTVRVSFQLNTRRDTVAQSDEIVQLVVALLDRVKGDAVFHMDYDYIYLLRREGILYVSDSDGFWTPQRLAMLPPHRRTALAWP